MKVATWNVNGIRARSSQVAHWIDGEEPDVVCLQEIKASAAQVPEPLASVAGYHVHWHGSGGYSGVALLLRAARFPATPQFVHPPFDLETRIVVAEVGSLVLASVYVPNGGKDFDAKMRFLEALDAYVEQSHAAGKRLIICGDVNIARADIDVHPKERKPKAIGQLPEERALLERVLSRGLVDTGRALDPTNDQMFTWWAPWRNLRQRNIGWRLDYVLATRSVFDRVTSCRVMSEFGTSDHAPVVASFDV
jgi:exodeoxyribonuclease-3